MKSSYLAMAGLLLMGCEHTENFTSTEQQTSANQQQTEALTLALQKPATTQGLTLTLQKAEDSRCPMNAMCIRQGSVITQVQVKDAQGNNATKILYLGDALTAPENRGVRSADTVNVALGSKTYRLILTEVQPYPNTSDPNPAEKTAKISVTAL
ncbi:hypothetical protein [Sabulibacter ruber]|uniref:hypothetical protein n=1 Tax=Sabulibacter ruber TaxID=2811901 RepID=UPI001A96ECB9|nr:hypothetical protein [Sabulibacter ruber]